MAQLPLEGYLRLVHSEHLGAARLSRLLALLGTITPLLSGSKDELTCAGLSPEAISRLVKARNDRAAQSKAAADLAWSRGAHRCLVCWESNAYPVLLREIPVPPPLLWVRGQVACLQRPMLAIVGSRRASSSGLQNARWMAMTVGQAGLGICSGLARGIDTEAHRGAIQAPAFTVAVMGTGADLVYPACNEDLAEQVAANGALVTEFALGTPPLPVNFPRRNRIISGLAAGTLVVEATRRSGSLITARLAAEQNREVFAIPGSIRSQGAAGCHQLIKAGAMLVESPQEILVELGFACPQGEEAAAADRVVADGSARAAILSALGQDGCVFDTLLALTGLPLPELSQELLQLEISGEIETLGGRYQRCHGADI